MNHHSPDKDYLRFFERCDTTGIIFGEGAFTQLEEKILLDGNHTVQLILGSRESALKNGAYQAFSNIILGFDIESPVFQGVEPEPSVETIRAIVKSLEDGQPDTVVALGGGSVMDAAKAAYLSWQSGLDVTELFGANKASEKFPGKEFRRVICIPTTAGTGSEVTRYANIVDRGKNLKYLISEPQIVPELALVDPAFTRSMGPALTAATALDALTHSIESLLNIHADSSDPDSGKWALESVKLITQALPRALKDPRSAIDREKLSAAATLGGMCIQTRPTALPHLCSYSLWGKIPHGFAVALLLPAFWRFYLESGNKTLAAKTMLLANFFPAQTAPENPADVVSAYENFLKSLSPAVPELCSIKGFGKELLQKIASDAAQNPLKLQNSPRKIDLKNAADTILKILLKTLPGKA